MLSNCIQDGAVWALNCICPRRERSRQRRNKPARVSCGDGNACGEWQRPGSGVRPLDWFVLESQLAEFRPGTCGGFRAVGYSVADCGCDDPFDVGGAGRGNSDRCGVISCAGSRAERCAEFAGLGNKRSGTTEGVAEHSRFGHGDFGGRNARADDSRTWAGADGGSHSQVGTGT